MVVVGFVTANLCIGAQPMSLEDLQEIIAAMESSILDVTVEYEWYSDPPMTVADIAGTSNWRNVSRQHSVLSTARPFSERSLFSTVVDVENERGDKLTANERSSYNGEVAKHLSLSGQIPDGTITKRKDFMPSWQVSPMAFSILAFYPELLSEQLRQRKEDFRLEDGIRKVNGFDTICLDFLAKNGKPYRQVYLSVDHGYAPVRLAYVSPIDGSVAASKEILELREIAKGIWFPVRGTVPDSNNVYEAKKVQVNRGLTKDDFDIQFPPGTRVVDEILGLEYVIQPSASVLRWRWYWCTAVILLLVIAVGSLAVVLKRRRK